MKILITALLLLLPSLLAAEDTVFRNVNVIPMDREEVLRDQVVVVRDGKILLMGPGENYQLDGNPDVIDGQGGYLLPGLAEMHAHVPGHGSGEQAVADVLNLYLVNGITTIRGMLGQPWHLELRQMLADNQWTGPRLFTSGPSLNGNSVTSSGQGAQMVRDQHAAGYDLAKLHPGLRREEFVAISNTAMALDFPFAGHVSNDVGLDLTLEQHQSSIDHLDGYANALVEPNSSEADTAPQFFGINLVEHFTADRLTLVARRTRDAGVWNAATQSLIEQRLSIPLEELWQQPGMDLVSDSTRASWEQNVRSVRDELELAGLCRVPATESQPAYDCAGDFIDWRRRLIAALQEAGAGLLLGSDAPQVMQVPGHSAHNELAIMVAAGLSPFQALRTGTVNVGRYFDVPTGMLREGQAAEFILLEDNPLEDIAATRTIRGVMHNGIYYDQDWIRTTLEGIRERGI